MSFHETLALRNSISAQIKGVEDQIRKQSKDESYDFKSLNERLTELHRMADEQRKNAEKRYTTSDSTPEKLADLLIENPNGILMVRDELFGFLKTLEKPGQENTRAFFLEAWSGTVENYRVDRIGRGSSVVPALRLSILGTIQPSRLRDFFAHSLTGGAGDDGFLQRLQLLVYPTVPPDWENVDRYPDTAAKEKVFQIFERLASFEASDIGARTEKFDSLPSLGFSQEAQDCFIEWLGKLEIRLRSGQIDCAAFESHLSKYRSLVPSLALLFHLIDWADGGKSEYSVSLNSVELAIKWSAFLEAHARKVYAGAIEPQVVSAHAIVAKISQKKIRSGMSLREIYRHHWANLDTSTKLESATTLLSDLGWLRVKETTTHAGGQSDTIELHPELE